MTPPGIKTSLFEVDDRFYYTTDDHEEARKYHEETDKCIRTESLEATRGANRLVILTADGREDGSKSARYWCTFPQDPRSWLRTPHFQHENEILGGRGWDAVPILESQGAVLSPDESDRPVGDLSLPDLLQSIHELWGGLLPVSVTTSKIVTEWLTYFIAQNVDFGMIHAWVSALREWLRRHWITEHGSKKITCRQDFNVELDAPSTYLDSTEEGEILAGLVAPALGRRIIEIDNGYHAISPQSDRRARRIWDVGANRVVPMAWFPAGFAAEQDGSWNWSDQRPITLISHAWVAPEERKYVITKVNGCTWPVPVPHDVQINTIRRELIRHNIRYAWLDVLCLRQDMEPLGTGGAPPQLFTELEYPHAYTPKQIKERNSLQQQEWRTDVTLIGAFYRQSNVDVLVYLSGLGRAPVLDGWQSERHWIRRAWTMQETLAMKPYGGFGCHTRFAGLQKSEVEQLLRTPIDSEQGTRFIDALDFATINCWQNVESGSKGLGDLLLVLGGRCATQSVDIVAALLYFCVHSAGQAEAVDLPLPIYQATERPSMAWTRLVQAASKLCTFSSGYQCTECRQSCPSNSSFVHQLLLLFPHPSAQHWFPSWHQVRAYPDVSSREPQLPDGLPPKLECEMRLYGGYLYRDVTVFQKPCPQDHQMVQYNIVATAHGGRLVTIPMCSSPLEWEKGGPRLLPGQRYVLIDITCSLATQLYTPDNIVIVVCRELTEWKPPRVNWEQDFTDASLLDPEAHEYRLRRVTTLEYQVPPYSLWSDRDDWFPLCPDLQPSEIQLNQSGFEHLGGRTVFFWDPSIIVKLQ